MYKFALFALMLFTHISLLAADVSQGETLERQYWEHIKNHKWKDFENKIAPYFQSATFDEIHNKEQTLNLAKTMNIGDYTLYNFKVTEGPGVLVVTYEIEVSETIDGRPIRSRANRLSVWQNNNNNWQLIAHAALIPVPPAR